MAATLRIWKFSSPEGAERAGTLARLQAERLITVRPLTWQARDVAGPAALSGAFWGLLFGILFLIPLVGMAAFDYTDPPTNQPATLPAEPVTAH